jgi:hypothetical protein
LRSSRRCVVRVEPRFVEVLSATRRPMLKDTPKQQQRQQMHASQQPQLRTSQPIA